MTQDIWAEWLLRGRFGGSDKDVWLERMLVLRDRVLDGASIEAGNTVLDVGCGDGLIAFGALDRGAAEVIFSDISLDLLAQAQRLAEEVDVTRRCRFVETSADDLGKLADASVDVVTTRSVLIYVKAKQAAFAEFHRVLRPGGRISLFEPINRFGDNERETTFCGYDIAPVSELAAKLHEVFDAIQPPDSDPMLDFDERDLIDLAAAARLPAWPSRSTTAPPEAATTSGPRVSRPH